MMPQTAGRRNMSVKVTKREGDVLTFDKGKEWDLDHNGVLSVYDDDDNVIASLQVYQGDIIELVPES